MATYPGLVGDGLTQLSAYQLLQPQSSEVPPYPPYARYPTLVPPTTRSGDLTHHLGTTKLNMFTTPHSIPDIQSQQEGFIHPSNTMLSSPQYQLPIFYHPVSATMSHRVMTMPSMPSITNMSSMSTMSSMSPLPVNYLTMPAMPPPNQTMNMLFNPAVALKEDIGDLLKTSKRKINLEDLGIKTELKKAKVETRALKAKRPGFTDDRYNETTYYMENGLRKVYPYYFTFTTFTKGRWVGESILEVFSREFRAHPQQEYARCINAGTLTVNYEKVDTDYKLRHNDLLANIVHRHEVPVTSEEIKIITMTDDLVVVNKPASIPVHPCGRYRHNTVVFILAKEYGFKNLRTIHRLDRLTSGLLMFGKSPSKAREMETQIRTRQVRKEYICRVEGEFPMGLIQCREPIEVVSYKIGVCKVAKGGKDCWTDFQRISFNGETSVVVCRPHTGRMHQIRVHLQYLGHPVINDPLYNHPVFGPKKGKGGDIGKSDDDLVKELIEIHNSENWLGENESEVTGPEPSLVQTCLDLNPSDKTEEHCESPDSGVSLDTTPYQNVSPDTTPHLGDSPDTTPNLGYSPDTTPHLGDSSDTTPHLGDSPDITPHLGDSPDTIPVKQTQPCLPDRKGKTDPHCYECTVRYRDPRPKDLVMFLHALKYQGYNWCYETELPYWARPEWHTTL